MVKHDHKRQKNKTGSLLYNITTSEDKTKKSNRRKVSVKALFQERENKFAFHQTLQNIHVSDRQAHIRYMITQT